MRLLVASVWLLASVVALNGQPLNEQVAREEPPSPMTMMRHRRQISYPQLEGPQPGQPGQPLLPAPQQQPPPPQTGGVFKFLSDLGPQVESAKMLSSLFSSPASGGSQAQPGGPQQQQPGGLSASQIMGQLSELIRSTQDRSAKMLASSQEQVASAGQQTLQATQGAQTGIQSALSELGANIQRLASNNPNLLPDLKNLYQSVSSKLVSSSSPVASPASGQQQFADNLAKMATSAPTATS